MERRGAFDYILLETTGLADPGNLAPLFWVDEGLGSTIYLDGIVTLVDAKNILRSLSDPTPAEEGTASSDTSMLVDVAQKPHDDHSGPHLSVANLQISHADVVVVNKSDLVTEAELEEVQQKIRSINMLAKIHVTSQSRVPALEGVLLDLHAYDNVDAEALEFASKGHSHLDPVGLFSFSSSTARSLRRIYTNNEIGHLNNYPLLTTTLRVSCGKARSVASSIIVGTTLDRPPRQQSSTRCRHLFSTPGNPPHERSIIDAGQKREATTRRKGDF